MTMGSSVFRLSSTSRHSTFKLALSRELASQREGEASCLVSKSAAAAAKVLRWSSRRLYPNFKRYIKEVHTFLICLPISLLLLLKDSLSKNQAAQRWCVHLCFLWSSLLHDRRTKVNQNQFKGCNVWSLLTVKPVLEAAASIYFDEIFA